MLKLKKLIKEFVGEIMLEKASGGQKLDSLTREITDILVKKMKTPPVYDKIYNKIPTTFVIEDAEISRLGMLPIDAFKVNFEFNAELEPQDFRVSGRYNSTPYRNEIELFLEYPDRPFRIRDIADIYSRITGGIRHELEHVAQHFSYGTHKLPSSPKTLREFLQYYLDPSEMEAYVTEAHMKARASKTSMEEELEAIFDEALNNADAAGLSLDEIDMFEAFLRENYVNYAKTRYPHSMG